MKPWLPCPEIERRFLVGGELGPPQTVVVPDRRACGIRAVAVGSTVRLHGRPSTMSLITATLDASAFGERSGSCPPEVLGTRRGFLRIGLGDRSGWAPWGEVVLELAAIIVDTGSGASVARVPLGGYVRSAAFSADGSRVLLYGESPFPEDLTPGGGIAYELRTSDFSAVRTLDGKTRAAEPPSRVCGGFYRPGTDDLYVLLFTWDGSGRRNLSAAEVDPDGNWREPIELGTGIADL